MAQMVVEWSTADPQLAAILSGVAALPVNSLERMAAEAALHTAEAQRLHRLIGRVRHEQVTARRNRRSSRARTPTTAPEPQLGDDPKESA